MRGVLAWADRTRFSIGEREDVPRLTDLHRQLRESYAASFYLFEKMLSSEMLISFKVRIGAMPGTGAGPYGETLHGLGTSIKKTSAEQKAPLGRRGALCGAQYDYWFRVNPGNDYAPTFPLYWIAEAECAEESELCLVFEPGCFEITSVLRFSYAGHLSCLLDG